MQLCLRVTFPLYNVVKSEIRGETLACGPDESRIVEQEVGCLLSQELDLAIIFYFSTGIMSD